MSTKQTHKTEPFSSSELGALAHLYRGELYRSKIWRTRLDTTTNWAVATTGIALSVTFSNAQNSPLPLILIGLLVTVFLLIEARRYRYFDIWRTRVRLLEVCFYGPLLRGEGVRLDKNWNQILCDDYKQLHFHISFLEALGRRLRRNYHWIFIVLGVSYLAKISIHPARLSTFNEFLTRAAIGPIPGEFVIVIGVLCYAALLLLAMITRRKQHASGRVVRPTYKDDPMLKLGFEI